MDISGGRTALFAYIYNNENTLNGRPLLYPEVIKTGTYAGNVQPYNKNTGEFRVPVQAFYYIALNVGVMDRTEVRYALYVGNTKMKEIIRSCNAQDGVDTLTANSILKIGTNQMVTVRVMSMGNQQSTGVYSDSDKVTSLVLFNLDDILETQEFFEARYTGGSISGVTNQVRPLALKAPDQASFIPAYALTRWVSFWCLWCGAVFEKYARSVAEASRMDGSGAPTLAR